MSTDAKNPLPTDPLQTILAGLEKQVQECDVRVAGCAVHVRDCRTKLVELERKLAEEKDTRQRVMASLAALRPNKRKAESQPEADDTVSETDKDKEQPKKKKQKTEQKKPKSKGSSSFGHMTREQKASKVVFDEKEKVSIDGTLKAWRLIPKEVEPNWHCDYCGSRVQLKSQTLQITTKLIRLCSYCHKDVKNELTADKIPANGSIIRPDLNTEAKFIDSVIGEKRGRPRLKLVPTGTGAAPPSPATSSVATERDDHLWKEELPPTCSDTGTINEHTLKSETVAAVAK